MPSPFEVLSIESDADDAAVERAYRQRVKDAHPDHGGSVQEFQLVRAAYEEITSGGEIRPVDSDSATEGADEEPDEPDFSSVEYLDYEVMADYGWEMDDEDLFEKAAAAGLDPSHHGHIEVEADESLLEAAEDCGFAWPYACRGGACANCAVAVAEGDLSQPVDHILPDEMTERGIRLSCVGAPIADDMKVVYNVKHLPDLDDLRLPPRPFKQAQADD